MPHIRPWTSLQEFASRAATSASASSAVGASAISGRSARCRRAARAASDPARRAGGHRARRPPRRGSARRSRSYSGRSSGPRGPFALTIVYRGDGADQLGDRYPRRGKEMQDQGHPQRGVAADVQRGSMTPPLPSPPITAPSSRMARATLASPTGARTSRRPGSAGRVLDDQTGGQIDHDRGVCAGTAASIQHGADGERQRVVLADRLAPLVHQRQPVHVRDPRPGRWPRPLSRTSAPSSPRFSGIGSGARGNRPSGSRLMPLHAAAEPLEQRRNGRGAGAAHAVERDMEPRRRMAATSISGSAEHGVEVARRPRRDPRAPRRGRPSPSAAAPARPARAPARPASASRKMPSGRRT